MLKASAMLRIVAQARGRKCFRQNIYALAFFIKSGAPERCTVNRKRSSLFWRATTSDQTQSAIQLERMLLKSWMT